MYLCCRINNHRELFTLILYVRIQIQPFNIRTINTHTSTLRFVNNHFGRAAAEITTLEDATILPFFEHNLSETLRRMNQNKQ